MTLDEYFAQFTDKELVERGWSEIRLLCGSKDKPKRWTMTIPVDPERDSDVLFGEILNRFAAAIEQIETQSAKITELEYALADLNATVGDAF
jgi:hypothetical protein